jgi:hypothetical protein
MGALVRDRGKVHFRGLPSSLMIRECVRKQLESWYGFGSAELVLDPRHHRRKFARLAKLDNAYHAKGARQRLRVLAPMACVLSSVNLGKAK